MIQHERTLQSECLRADDWIVWGDSDEFQVYPASLPDLIEEFETRGIDPQKVALARAGVMLSGGKQFPIGMEKLKPLDGWVQVHHFKWGATVIQRPRHLVRPEWKAKFPWWVESQHLIDDLLARDMRFDPPDLDLIDLAGPGYIALQ